MALRAIPYSAALVWSLTPQAALARSHEPEPNTAAARPSSDVGVESPRFEFGGRLELAPIESFAGVDLGYRPASYVGVGLVVGYGAFLNYDLSACTGRCRDAEWTIFSPYVEVRAVPESFVSPYSRISAGIAHGTFTFYSDDPTGTELRGHAEFGVDFHAKQRGISCRVFLGESIGASNQAYLGSVFGFPGIGVQLGARI